MKDAEFVPSMTKSDLIDNLSRNQGHLAYKDVELAVKSLIEMMSSALSNGERIEIRVVLAVSACITVHHVPVATPSPATRWICQVSMFRISSLARSCAIEPTTRNRFLSRPAGIN